MKGEQRMKRSQFSYFEGAFTVELQPNAPTEQLGSGCYLESDILSVPVGTVKQVQEGIQFNALSPDGNRSSFLWSYEFIRCIRNAGGHIIWQNACAANG